MAGPHDGDHASDHASDHDGDDEDHGRAGLSAHARKNRAMWEAASDSYDEEHAAALSGTNAMAWGLWRIPEEQLQVLGDVSGKDVLELGCGAARWSIALAKQGARCTGLDVSPRQLSHARRLMAEAGVRFPLVEASAEAVPLPDASFDVVFCDWGAMTFTDPLSSVAEASRLLRPGGLFAFATAAPLAIVCHDRATDTLEHRLVNDYFGMHRIEWDDTVEFQLPVGEWIRLFRRHGLVVEDLIEVQPPADAVSSYRTPAETEWARHWPMENIWRLRKVGVG